MQLNKQANKIAFHINNLGLWLYLTRSLSRCCLWLGKSRLSTPSWEDLEKSYKRLALEIHMDLKSWSVRDFWTFLSHLLISETGDAEV